jgi:hypothetical protein
MATPQTLVRKRARAAAKAPNLAELLRGTLRQRYIRCGKATCHCQKGRGHGPVLYLSVTVGPGRTKQVTVAPDDAAVARKFLRNYRELIEIVKRVSEANRELLRGRSLKDSLSEMPDRATTPTRRRKPEG